MKQQPFIVVDQNCMRDADRVAKALERCCRERLQLLIPEGAFFEFSTGTAPFDTWRRSLERFSPYPELVSVSRKLTGMTAEEIQTGQPCDGLVHSETTEYLRSLLADLARGDETMLCEMIDGPIRNLLPPYLAEWSDSTGQKAMIQVIHDQLKETLEPGQLKQLRRSPNEGVLKWLSSVAGTRFVFQGIQFRGASPERAMLLSMQPSVSAAFIAALAALALHWLAFGGLASAASEKLTNDLHDIEYAVLGSLSVDLLSVDKRLMSIYRAVARSSQHRHEKLPLACVHGPGHLG